MLPVALCYAEAHSASVFSFSAGSVSFGQMVKAAELAFTAVLSQFVYKKTLSSAKWACLPIFIGGVILVSVNELDFAWSALISACIANMFGAVKGNENKKLLNENTRRAGTYWIGGESIHTHLHFRLPNDHPLHLLNKGGTTIWGICAGI